MKIEDYCVCGDEICIYTERPAYAMKILDQWKAEHNGCKREPLMKYAEDDDDRPGETLL